ncbi:IucA/IucC family protein [Paenibacillus sp. y28]|uniref:IucA/IucC family protein n=1 Tax=Paenibacillus sp. y28 TaxID=3129110 RepID=UPI00301A75F2
MLPKYELPLAETADCRVLAEQAAVRGMLNCYLRETGIYDPRLSMAAGSRELFTEEAGIASDGHGEQRSGASAVTPADARLRLVLGRLEGTQEEAFAVHLPRSGVWIAGQLNYFSATGQHQYGAALYTWNERDGEVQPALPEQLIDRLLAEVSLRDQEAARERRAAEMRGQITNSIRRMALYLEHAAVDREAVGIRPLDYIRSEQSLLAGHPFHPTPKSSEGFTDAELGQFAPELGASFQLHYMAVSKELLIEEWIGEPFPVPSAVQRTAAEKLGPMADGYCLLPLHPWQAEYVSALGPVRQMKKQGKLVDLGPLGEPVYPTSSVRTVWDPAAGVFYKLPLHVRITNFIRENTPSQIRRTMDAALVLRQAFRQGARGGYEQDGMCILPETGFQTVQAFTTGGISALDREQLLASFAVVYRQAEEIAGANQASCFVIASLLEQVPGQNEPLLFQAVRQSNQGLLPDWGDWLLRYLELSLLPLIRVFASKGISLEAHVQNSLVKLEQGLPVRYFVRDLEGISISEAKAARLAWAPQVVPSNSPVLYTEAEAWLRLKYYFIVNHLGALIHTIARANRQDELVYWRVARTLLEEQLARSGPEDEWTGWLLDLLTCRELPAKANLISRFQERGETPDFITIPNPIYECGGSR